MTALEGALAAAGAGLKVFPCHGVDANKKCSCANPDCKSPGKHPRIKGWRQEATTDANRIRAWFGFWPTANYGICCGSVSGIWVLDIDPKNGGDESLAKLEAEYEALSPTAIISTGSGGAHLYYKYVDGLRNSGSRIAPGIDTRAEGGYVIGVGCTTDKGSYTVLADDPIIEAPPWLIDLAIGKANAEKKIDVPDWVPLVLSNEELQSIRLEALTRARALPPGREGFGGAAAMLRLCRDIFRGWGLPDDEVSRAIVAEYAARCEPPWEDTHEIEHKIAQGKDGAADLDNRGIGYLLAGARVSAAFVSTKTSASTTTTRPIIRLGTDEYRCVDEAITHLSTLSDLFAHTQTTSLADVIEQSGNDAIEKSDGVHIKPENVNYCSDGLARFAGAPRIRQLPQARVRTLITAVTDIEKWDARSKDFVPANPTEWLVAGTCAEGRWRKMRKLVGLGDSPVILGDGRILWERGHDRESGIFVTSNLRIDVPERPTEADARKSIGQILDIVSEFEFATPIHLATWVCALLTIFARFAHNGPTPLFLLEASTAGSGKTLLADLISAICFGRPASRMPWSPHDEEMRKKITSAAMAGDRMLLLDNVPNGGVLASSALDAALTNNGWWKDRLLGTNEVYDGPLLAVFFATGNNLSLGGDLGRRVAHVRLEPTVDQPELRGNFRYPRLLQYAQQHRSRLASAAMTVLKAHCVAGRPAADSLPPWGSFEGWSAAARAPLVWLGLGDPAAARQGLQESDQGRGAAANLVHEVALLLENRHLRGITTKQVVQASMEMGHERLRDALEELVNGRPGQPISGKQIGKVFSSLRGRRFDGKAIAKTSFQKDHTTIWTVLK